MSATTNLNGDAIVMAENPRPLEQMLHLTEEEPSAEHLDNQVQKAQEQLLQLKRQQEQIEKQKRELEELSRRQDELEHGRGEMTDKLTRALVVLEREAYNAQSRLEQIRVARESFAQHLEVVEAIDPRNWNPSDLHKELSRSLSMVDDARTEYTMNTAADCKQAAAVTASSRCPMPLRVLTKTPMDAHFPRGCRSASR